MRRGLPGGGRRAALHGVHRRGAVLGGARDGARGDPAAGGLRADLLPPLRAVVPAGHHGGAGGDQRRQAGGGGARLAWPGAHGGPAHGEAGCRGGVGAGGPDRGLLPRQPPGARRHAVRGDAQARRHARRRDFPEYKVPRDLLEEEIGRICATRVEVRTGVWVESIDELADEYDAVLLAVGQTKPRALEVAGGGPGRPGRVCRGLSPRRELGPADERAVERRGDWRGQRGDGRGPLGAARRRGAA